MKNDNRNFYFFKWKKGFMAKTNNRFIEICVGLGLVSFVFLHGIPDVIRAIVDLIKVLH